jgi:hypothetical protein
VTAAPDLSPTPPSPRRRWTPASLFRRLGPGLITGAAAEPLAGRWQAGFAVFFVIASLLVQLFIP